MNIKKEILNHMLRILEDKIEESTRSLQSVMEARNSDTKSSAGDKHETGRAMMQIELDKEEDQLAKVQEQKRELGMIKPDLKHHKVESGSLVKTNEGNYFFSISFGKIMLGKENYFAISMVSPIGQALKDKIAGEKIRFQDREIKILEIS